MACSILPLGLYQEYNKNYAYLYDLLYNTNYNDSKILTNKMVSLMINGCLIFQGGDNPFQGVNVILWERNRDDELLPELLFTLEMKNYSFTIPVIKYDKVHKPQFCVISDFKEALEISVLNFKSEESVVKIAFEASKTELSESVKDEILKLICK
ncbi:MAG: hypothetical protein DBY32_01975 [Phascolarctobacterium sp.]|nr:MAG: hypothetical protein DBY32_01975 [Phascolarctobacterium sp.]